MYHLLIVRSSCSSRPRLFVSWRDSPFLSSCLFLLLAAASTKEDVMKAGGRADLSNKWWRCLHVRWLKDQFTEITEQTKRGNRKYSSWKDNCSELQPHLALKGVQVWLDLSSLAQYANKYNLFQTIFFVFNLNLMNLLFIKHEWDKKLDWKKW